MGTRDPPLIDIGNGGTLNDFCLAVANLPADTDREFIRRGRSGLALQDS